MENLKIIRHSEVSIQNLSEIISLKSLAWPYSYSNQIKWINEHIKASDLHLILYDGSRAVAYLNLIVDSLLIDEVTYSFLGIGNVCAIEKKKGYGSQLLKLTNLYIEKENKIGLLFCKSSLVGFYDKYNWRVIDKYRLSLPFEIETIETMIFNFSTSFNRLIFNGQAF